MNKIDGLEIPQNHVDFANAVAELADKYGLDRFTMTYRPKFEDRHFGMDRRINGEMKIGYSSVDGRGRPCRNLAISCDASFSLQIESNPESYS